MIALSRQLAPVLLLAFIFAAVFGLYAMVALSPHEHEAGCASLSPLSVVCAEVLVHVGHWQNALLAIVVEILVVVALALFLVTRLAALAGEVVKLSNGLRIGLRI
ncbi:hypothetical protein A3F55_02840 [Candidatus Adlerbacteria bacterium RIFCSPHIGHO2_12_FULL_53_18]|uniref:Uncharacterized protein n=1 Tax=Candidatus Adlerbacteria bacterium RIFCSPHIGHO2_12_FULL_53_18 TaxID=1797242 RepID=A0A1F4XT75_9BACT|nr:MAG: hypothetical protein A3F55_02840 [Candidatus Adlerbacteria bacterium RIFCSPHIGHO2_12_FULL_53_18]